MPHRLGKNCDKDDSSWKFVQAQQGACFSSRWEKQAFSVFETLVHSGEDTKKPSRRRDIKRQATIDPWSQYCDKVAMLSACHALAENREKDLDRSADMNGWSLEVLVQLKAQVDEHTLKTKGSRDGPERAIRGRSWATLAKKGACNLMHMCPCCRVMQKDDFVLYLARNRSRQGH